MKVGLETVVKELPDVVVKASEYDYLKPFIPQGLKETFKGPDEIRRFRHNDAAEITDFHEFGSSFDGIQFGNGLDRTGHDVPDLDPCQHVVQLGRPSLMISRPLSFVLIYTRSLPPAGIKRWISSRDNRKIARVSGSGTILLNRRRISFARRPLLWRPG